MLPSQLLSLECRGACRGFSIKKPHRCLLSSLGGEWEVLGDGSNLVLSQTWKEFWPETRKMEDDSGMECLRGRPCQESTAVKTDPCLALLALPPHPCPPSTNTTMLQWHGWYEGNCGFCLNPGHMQMIKNSNFQNPPQVNKLLIQVSSSSEAPPPAQWKEAFI